MPESLVGIWTLQSVEFRVGPNEVRYPFGPKPVGLLVISPDGHLALQVMDPRRARFASGDVLGATTEERASAMHGYSAYSGRYEVQGNRLIMRLETSLFPNWVGQTEERTFEIAGDVLVVRTKSVRAGGAEVSADVTWKRCSGLRV